MYFLGIDQGGSSSRALVCDRSGKIISQGQCQVSTERSGVIVEQKTQCLYESVIKSIHQCLAKLSVEQISKIQSASLVTQRSSFVAVNSKTKETLSNIISWQDTRAQQELEHLAINNKWLRATTGLKVSAHYGASKMKWSIDNNEKVISAACANELLFLPLASYLVSKLTDNESFCVDPANAARTLLLDINTLHWQETLLDIFAIKRDFLPKILSTIDHFGHITLTKNDCVNSIPLKYVNGDQSAAMFAYGEPKESKLLVNMGTGAFISKILSTESLSFIDDSALLRSIVHVDKEKTLYVLEGTVNGCGAAIDKMAILLGVDKTLLKDIACVNKDIPLFINTIGGLGAPYWRTDISSRFIGEGSSESKLIAVLESVVFLITVLVELLSSSPPKLDSLIVSGGMSNNMALCQMLADLSGYKVKAPNEVEASVLGSIWWLADCPKNWLPELAYKYYLPRENAELKSRYVMWSVEMDKLLNVSI
jgi:glycerol kinase